MARWYFFYQHLLVYLARSKLSMLIIIYKRVIGFDNSATGLVHTSLRKSISFLVESMKFNLLEGACIEGDYMGGVEKLTFSGGSYD